MTLRASASKAPEGFDPARAHRRGAAGRHIHNLYKKYGLLSTKGLFWLIKMGWLSLADVRPNLHLLSTTISRTSNGTRLLSCSAPELIDSDHLAACALTPSGCRCCHPDDFPDTYFFGYNSTGFLKNNDEGEAPLHLRHPPSTPPMPAETASSSRAIEGKMVGVKDLAETSECQEFGQGTELRGTEIFEKGVLASRSIDFVFQNWRSKCPFFYCYVISIAVASLL